MGALLEVKDLKVSYHTYAGEVQAVRGVSFGINKSEAVAIVGESGCGKTVTAKSIMGLIQCPPA
ncbi:MAG: oppD, partial [Clostridiales bacterium]|nr:oppD [Clostridiales bacterium]